MNNGLVLNLSPYYKKLRSVEKELLRRVDDLISKEESISESEFTKLIKEANNFGWKKAEELIK